MTKNSLNVEYQKLRLIFLVKFLLVVLHTYFDAVEKE